jgi:hypothetical protein
MLYVTSPDSTPRAMVLRADKFRERDELPYHELRLSIGTVDEKTTILGPGVVFPRSESSAVGTSFEGPPAELSTFRP